MKYYLIGFALAVVFMGGIYGALGMPTCKEYGYKLVPETVKWDYIYKYPREYVVPAHYEQYCLVWS